MSLLEDRVLRIIELREKGLDDVAVAEELDLSVGMVSLYERQLKRVLNKGLNAGEIGISELALSVVLGYYGSREISRKVGQKRKRKNKPFEDSLNDIRQSIKRGARDYYSIVEDTGLSLGTVYVYVRKGGIQLPDNFVKRQESKDKKIGQIRDAVEQGIKSMEELQDKISLKPRTIAIYCRDNNIEVPFDLQRWIYYQENDSAKDVLIKKGEFTLEELGKQPEFQIKGKKITRERVRHYIVGTEQVEVYHEARKRFKRELLDEERKRKFLLGSLVRGVCNHKVKEELDDIEVFAYEMAIEYEGGLQMYPRDFWRNMKIYKRYISAVMEDRKVSLEKLGEGFNLFPSTVSKLLKQVGEEPITGSRERRSPLSSEEVALVERAYETDLNGVELEYFTGIKGYIFNRRFNRIKKESETKREVKRDFRRFNHVPVNRGLLSEIYLAKDMGYSNEDMCEMFGVCKDLVDYASEHRDKYGSEIVKALKKLYPDKADKITKPYLE